MGTFFIVQGCTFLVDGLLWKISEFFYTRYHHDISLIIMEVDQ